MRLTLLYYIYLSILLIAWLVSLYRFRSLDSGGKLISVLIGLTFVTECLAFLFSKLYHNNLAVYCLFSLVQVALFGLYFNETIDVFRRRRVGIWIGLAGVILGVLNVCCFQPLHSYNSYFLFFESILVISMSLFFFARLMLREDSQRLVFNPHFWISAILTFFWSATFFNWGFYEYMNTTRPGQAWVVNVLLLMVNICTYGALGIVFYCHPIRPPQKS